ncbi:hypothetical protein KCP73_06775 [Salmonella enterica subsp. enterica]|nr:hypothetical protein KCP73_06775 [Salmonella enterica subsp. enterica]
MSLGMPDGAALIRPMYRMNVGRIRCLHHHPATKYQDGHHHGTTIGWLNWRFCRRRSSQDSPETSASRYSLHFT